LITPRFAFPVLIDQRRLQCPVPSDSTVSDFRYADFLLLEVQLSRRRNAQNV